MTASHPEYVLGHGTKELDRLIRQAAFYGDLTAHTVKLAGLAPGMRVLDVGCGAGDVSLLAASIVGPTGHVTGVDQNADALALARSRVATAGVSHLTFESADIAALPYAGKFDAVIGRLVILYLGGPVAGIKAFASYLRPGGLLYFEDFRPPGIGAVPPVPLYDEVVRRDQRDVRASEDRPLHRDAARQLVSGRRAATSDDDGDGTHRDRAGFTGLHVPGGNRPQPAAAGRTRRGDDG